MTHAHTSGLRSRPLATYLILLFALLLAAGGVALHLGGSLAATLAGFATVALLRR